MGQPKALTAQRVAELEQAVSARWAPEAFRRFQCVWLSHVLGLSAPAIAEALGLNPSSVRRIWAQFVREGATVIDGNGNRGGRRNQHMTFEEEAAFLREHSALFDHAGSGLMGALKEAFERRVGGAVHRTTIYRLLVRHGRTKVTARSSRSASSAVAGSSRWRGVTPPSVSQGRIRKPNKVR
jgi:transposase